MGKMSYIFASWQSGYVLATSLVFLIVLSVVAITAMRSTTLELRMSANAAFKTRALNASEGVRTLTSEVVDAHIYNRGWPAAIGGPVPDFLFALNIPTGLTVLDKDTNSAPDDLWDTNGAGEDLLVHSSLAADMQYRLDGDNSGSATVNDDMDIVADLMVYRTVTKLAAGSGTEMISGYSTLGRGSAAGGGYAYYELRSLGQAPASAQAVTASDFRHLIRN